MTIAFFGDVVGPAGRRAFAHAAAIARTEFAARFVIVNGENESAGRGLSSDGYAMLRTAGADAVTLGDHALDHMNILKTAREMNEPLSIPANWGTRPRAKRSIRLPIMPGGGGAITNIYIITILGRLFVKAEATDPFTALDEQVQRVSERDPGAAFVIEVHAEATSEKYALAWHAAERWPGCVLAVVGTHTHVQTNDARLLGDRIAFIADVGMCGASEGIIGFTAESSLARFRNEPTDGLRVATAAPVACGCLIEIDIAGRCALGIRPIRIPLEETAGPASSA